MTSFDFDPAKNDEARFIAFGMVRGVVYGMIYTDRVDHVRIISVRRATSRETNRYLQVRG